jgi:hypothetical protein
MSTALFVFFHFLTEAHKQDNIRDSGHFAPVGMGS